MAYALLVEQVWALALCDRGAALAAGVPYGDLPDPVAEVARFEESLLAIPEHVEPEDEELLVALGLRGRRG